MKEIEIINTIKETLSDNHYIGNDVADLREVGMFITQDVLVEDIHFNLKTTTPYKLGQKAVSVNISDLAVAICNPAYISIGLSLPKNISIDFVREFYEGVDSACKKYNVAVTGGDITSAEKIHISVAAVGRRRHDINTSRSFAKPGQFIISTGFYGSGAAGLFALQNGIDVSEEIINAQLTPEARLFDAFEAGRYIEENIAVMDTSDGLADALVKISKDSKVSINVNFEDIPVLPEVKELAEKNQIDLKDWVLWGGEDYELILCVPYHYFAILSSKGFKYIGSVEENINNPQVIISENGNKTIITEELFNKKSYNHFGG